MILFFRMLLMRLLRKQTLEVFIIRFFPKDAVSEQILKALLRVSFIFTFSFIRDFFSLAVVEFTFRKLYFPEFYESLQISRKFLHEILL